MKWQRGWFRLSALSLRRTRVGAATGDGPPGRRESLPAASRGLSFSLLFLVILCPEALFLEPRGKNLRFRHQYCGGLVRVTARRGCPHHSPQAPPQRLSRPTACPGCRSECLKASERLRCAARAESHCTGIRFTVLHVFSSGVRRSFFQLPPGPFFVLTFRWAFRGDFSRRCRSRACERPSSHQPTQHRPGPFPAGDEPRGTGRAAPQWAAPQPAFSTQPQARSSRW